MQGMCRPRMGTGDFAAARGPCVVYTALCGELGCHGRRVAAATGKSVVVAGWGYVPLAGGCRVLLPPGRRT